MPRKWKRARKKRQSRRKKYPLYKSITTASNSKGPLATKLPCKFIYEDSFSLDPGVAGTAATYVFSCNGLYDPNITGVGHQPRGFDQLMALYDHYVVVGSKITAWVSNNDSGNVNMAAMFVSDTSTATTDPSDIMERRFVKIKEFGEVGTGQATGNFNIKVNPNKFLGRSSPLSDPDLKGSATANPTEQCYFHVTGFPLLSGLDSLVMYLRVRIEYYAILIEPKQPGQS